MQLLYYSDRGAFGHQLMTSIGETLRRERLRRGWALDKVSNETKINRRLLEAIEANQFDRLPGGVFAKIFVRQYARLLGLDDEEMAAEMKRQFEEPEPVVVVPEPESPPLRLPQLPPLEEIRQRLRMSSSAWAFLWLVVVVVGCAGVYSLWQTRRLPPVNPAPIAAVPQSRRPEVSKPASLTQNAPAEPSKSEFRPAEISESGTIRVPARPAQNPSVEKVSNSTLNAPQAAQPAALRVSFTATQPVWISITVDGNRVYKGTLAPHETRQVEASRKVFIRLGNAGGLETMVNGKPVGPFGPPGEIRWVELTPQGAHVVPRNPPAPPPTSGDSTAPAAAADIRP